MGNYRENVGIILVNDSCQVFWAQRIKDNYWQFPQGGIEKAETIEQALYRELYEEIGLTQKDVSLLGDTKEWISYDFPIKRVSNGVIFSGQKQRWFLLKLMVNVKNIKFDCTKNPEFKAGKWVDYWYPLQDIVDFKREAYEKVLLELRTYLSST